MYELSDGNDAIGAEAFDYYTDHDGTHVEGADDLLDHVDRGVSGILNTEYAENESVDNLAEPGPDDVSIVPSPSGEPPLELDGRAPAPLKYKQIHFIGSAATEVKYGDHSDPAIQGGIAAALAEHAQRQEYLTDYLQSAPNKNECYAQEIDTLCSMAHEQFGTTPPITILSPQQFNAARLIGGDSREEDILGTFLRGHVLIKADPFGLDRYGPQLLVSLGAHEIGHTDIGGEDLVVISQLSPPDISDDVSQWVGADGQWYRVDTGVVCGLSEVVVSDLPHNPKTAGMFWEESFADHTRVRLMEERGVAWHPDAPMSVRRNAQVPDEAHEPLAFAEDTAGLQHIDKSSGQVVVPWRYVRGYRPNTYGDGLFAFDASGLAGYTMELLDRELPGIYDIVRHSRTDPALKQAFKDQVNSIQPELYEKQAQLPYTVFGFQQGLLNVVRALGLERAPMRR